MNSIGEIPDVRNEWKLTPGVASERNAGAKMLAPASRDYADYAEIQHTHAH
jgi:hypothetical protein